MLAADPRASIAHYPLALAYRGLGDTAKAEAHLRQQGKTEVGPPDPRMAELRNLLEGSAAEEARGMRAAEGGDFKAAVEHFRKGVELAPDSVSLRYNLARALSLTGDVAGAKAAFEETIRRAPRDAGARLALGELLGRSGDFEAALDAVPRGAGDRSRGRPMRASDMRVRSWAWGAARRRWTSLTESARLFPDDQRFTQAIARLRGGRL